MFQYFSKLYESARIYAYNYLNDTTDAVKKYPPLQSDESHEIRVDDKQLRLDTLLYIKQFKNTYYKYTNKAKFNPELYNTFIKDDQFDGGVTAFDDDDENVRIFDKYILEYIKNRNDMITYLQCKNKDISLKIRLEDLTDMSTSVSDLDVLFVMDMSEKDMFTYCYSILQANGNILMVKNIIFSMILKYKGEYIRMKLSAFNKNKNMHPYVILEGLLGQ
jgi:hypothetical protein